MEQIEIYKDTGDRDNLAISYIQAGDVFKDQLRYEEANHFYEKGFTISAEVSEWGVPGLALLNMGDMAIERGDYDQAEDYLQRSLKAFPSATWWAVPLALDNLGCLACVQGYYELAQDYFKQALRCAMHNGAIPFALNILANTARLLLDTGNAEQAVELLSVVQNHPALENQTRIRRVNPILDKAKSQLEDDAFERAYQQGTHADFERLAAQLCDD